MTHRRAVGVAASACTRLRRLWRRHRRDQPRTEHESPALGAGEGVVTTLNWAGYVEDGSTYPSTTG